MDEINRSRGLINAIDPSTGVTRVVAGKLSGIDSAWRPAVERLFRGSRDMEVLETFDDLVQADRRTAEHATQVECALLDVRERVEKRYLLTADP